MSQETQPEAQVVPETNEKADVPVEQVPENKVEETKTEQPSQVEEAHPSDATTVTGEQDATKTADHPEDDTKQDQQIHGILKHPGQSTVKKSAGVQMVFDEPKKPEHVGPSKTKVAHAKIEGKEGLVARKKAQQGTVLRKKDDPLATPEKESVSTPVVSPEPLASSASSPRVAKKDDPKKEGFPKDKKKANLITRALDLDKDKPDKEEKERVKEEKEKAKEKAKEEKETAKILKKEEKAKEKEAKEKEKEEKKDKKDEKDEKKEDDKKEEKKDNEDKEEKKEEKDKEEKKEKKDKEEKKEKKDKEEKKEKKDKEEKKADKAKEEKTSSK